MRCWDRIDPWCLQDHVQPVVSSTSRCLHAYLSSWFIWPWSHSGPAVIFFSQTMNNVLQSPLWSINYGLWLRGVVTSCLVDDPAIISWTMNPFQPSIRIHTHTNHFTSSLHFLILAFFPHDQMAFTVPPCAKRQEYFCLSMPTAYSVKAQLPELRNSICNMMNWHHNIIQNNKKAKQELANISVASFRSPTKYRRKPQALLCIIKNINF